jgi:hypothetical protein
MGTRVVENLASPVYRFTDPDAFRSGDNPECFTPWLRGSGLMVWAIEGHFSSGSHSTERLLVACSPHCLRFTASWYGRSRRMSELLPIADWLDALRARLN